jgi:hypothetical protein
MYKFLATTAIVMSLSAPAFGQSETTAPADGPDTSGVMNTDTSGTMSTESGAMATDTPAGTIATMGIGSVMANPTDLFASNLIGMCVYNVEQDMDATMDVAAGSETEWDDIGEINDIIVTADGDVSAVVLGIGGFIGIGERDVTVPMSAISVVQEEGESNDYFLVVKTSVEELEAAPAFERAEM